jgi:putative toxin-antitoxin system antitoxin component (TIGR02293 family)
MREGLARVPLEILEVGLSALGSESELWSWLTTPAREFSDSRPIDLLKTNEGSGKVRELLGAIEHGVYW